MTSTIRKAALISAALGTAAAFGTPAAFASSSHPSATPPHITPANKVIAGTSTKATFSGATIDGVNVSVSCTSFKSSGKTPAKGLTVTLPKAPTFSGCTDSLGGVDTVKTAGAWSITANSTGSMLAINLPKDAATFSSNALSGCVITIAPNGTAKLAGKFNNSNKLTITNASFPIVGNSECTTSATSKATTVVTFKPSFKVVS